ncbi:hypothetical protein [Pendulispora albinea]|uniref:Uncharacterized protein n=1 Tax=Pendulispora albinea TaxID=2741071 RepID=A0ABZ2LYC1_9BACT
MFRNSSLKSASTRMGMAGVAALVATLVACASGSSSPPPATGETPSPSAGNAPSPAASNASPAATGSAAAATPKACGCALCEPVVSDDACTTDADCAPSVPCHAPKCVAKAKAVARTPDTMCTMMMACTSADSNACGCLKGKCALYPKP